MKHLLILLLIFPTLVRGEELWLRVGEARSLSAPSGKSIRVGTRGILKVIDGNSSVKIVGLKPGVSPLIIGNLSYLVRVSLSNQKEFSLALRDLLKNMMGLKLRSDTNPLSIGGTLLRFSDWQRIADLARTHQGEYVFAAQALPDVARRALDFLGQQAREKGFPVVRFRADPEFTAQVPKAAAGLKAGIAHLFKPYGIRIESTDSELMLQPLVRTRVILAELSKEDSTQFGVRWPSEYQAQIIPHLAGSPDALMVALQALEARGQAQILASPNLLCRSGSEARFHAGGEFPIRIISKTTHDVIWKQHGVLLRVKPQADFQGSISLEIETEVSLLDMANAVEGIPALKSNTVKSHFDLPGKRTIAISGLLRQELGESKEGLPYLTRIPILGALFSSQSYMKRQSELVIFVTPEIYVPEADTKVEMPEGWVRDEP